VRSNIGRFQLSFTIDKKRYPIELKLCYGDKTLAEGFDQIARYMDTLNCNEGWLVIFDRRINVILETKIFMKKKKITCKTITIV
jgi:hypothetical protein